MADQIIGRQTPTLSVVLPYKDTKGQEAVDKYNATGRTAQEWQELMVYDLLAQNEDGLWTHSKFGYSIPRRNGKSEVLIIRELYGILNGEKILHTAHRTATSHSAWERVCDLLFKAGYREKEDFKTLKQFGFESIEMVKGEGRINFRTRSSKGGLGEGYDLLIIDEAQEYTEDQESALKYVVSDSKNPQTLMCGTPPTPTSSGTVFTKYRSKVISGASENNGWAEWSVEFMSDIHDRALWYECNPSLGTILTERSVADEIGTDDIDFNVQRLGLWLAYDQRSAISKPEWDELTSAGKPKLKEPFFVGVKFGIDGTNAAASVAARDENGRIFVEALDCQPVRSGISWITEYIAAIKPKKVVIDGASGQKLLAEAMKQAKLKGAVLPTVKEVVTANALFEQGIFSKEVCHAGQPALAQAATNAEKRAIGTNGGFGFRSLKEGIEVALLDSVILAFWACSENKERAKQQVRY